MGQNTCKNFLKWNFSKNCSESYDSSKKLKILKSIFTNTKWVKTLEIFFKNRTFQKNAKNFLICPEN